MACKQFDSHTWLLQLIQQIIQYVENMERCFSTDDQFLGKTSVCVFFLETEI